MAPSRNEQQDDIYWVAAIEAEPPIYAPLCDAIRSGDEALVQDRMQGLSDVSTLTPKETAIEEHRPDFLRLLLKHDNYIDVRTISTACAEKDRTYIKMLLEFGWPINKCIGICPPVLVYANQDLHLTQWLVERGADVNAQCSVGQTPVTVAVLMGSMDVVHFLFTQELDVARGDLLHAAARRENTTEGAELIKELVRRGIDIEGYEYDNRLAYRFRGLGKYGTALHVACEKGNVRVVEALLESGADPQHLMNGGGRLEEPTCWQSALASGNQEVVEAFKASYPRLGGM